MAIFNNKLFITDDAGRSCSRRAKQSNDCTVRALAKACSLNYDTAYDYLTDNGRVCSKGYFLNHHLDITAKRDSLIFGYKVRRLPFPAVKGQERMNIWRFLEQYNNGIYIIRVSKHMATIINGYLYDDKFFSRDPFRCVYTAYQLIKQ